MAWGLPANIGHNNGPPLEDEVNDGFVRYRWRKAHAAAWKNPSLSVLQFRVQRAEAAGVSYREYMLELLDSGRHLQAGDKDRRQGQGKAARPSPVRPSPVSPSRSAGSLDRSRTSEPEPEPGVTSVDGGAPRPR